MLRMKKQVSLITSTCLLAATLLGCSSSAVSSSTEADVSSSENDTIQTDGEFWHPTEKITIRFGDWADTDRHKNAIQHAIDVYNKIQPNVEVEWVPMTFENAQTWTTMQLTGGTAPDIFHSKLPWANDNYSKGYVRDLAGLLDSKSPYVDTETFGDFFSPSILRQLPDGNGVISGLCTFVDITKIYYNKALFEQAGITELPDTWNEFMDIQQKLLDNGTVPFAFPNSKPADNIYNWCERLLTYQVVEDIIPELDINGSGTVENNEICRGIDLDLIKIDSDPYQTVFPLIKEWSKYWSQGYNSIDATTAEQMFVRQEAAMFFGFPSTAQNMADMGAAFEYGVFSFPYLTKENTEYACEKYYEMGGNVAEVWCIPTSTEGEKLQAAEDFLMFLGSPEAMKIWADERFLMPTAAEPVSDSLNGWIPQGELVKLNLYGPAVDQKFSDDSVMFGQLYIQGDISLEEYLAEMQTSLKDMSERLKATNGWDENNNYGITAE